MSYSSVSTLVIASTLKGDIRWFSKLELLVGFSTLVIASALKGDIRWFSKLIVCDASATLRRGGVSAFGPLSGF